MKLLHRQTEQYCAWSALFGCYRAGSYIVLQFSCLIRVSLFWMSTCCMHIVFIFRSLFFCLFVFYFFIFLFLCQRGICQAQVSSFGERPSSITQLLVGVQRTSLLGCLVRLLRSLHLVSMMIRANLSTELFNNVFFDLIFMLQLADIRYSRGDIFKHSCGAIVWSLDGLGHCQLGMCVCLIAG